MLTTNKTHHIVTLLCVENLYLELVCNVVILRSHWITQCRNKPVKMGIIFCTRGSRPIILSGCSDWKQLGVKTMQGAVCVGACCYKHLWEFELVCTTLQHCSAVYNLRQDFTPLKTNCHCCNQNKITWTEWDIEDSCTHIFTETFLCLCILDWAVALDRFVPSRQAAGRGEVDCVFTWS